MISIIICSRKSDISEELKTNIAQTIGVEYELLIIDNSRNKHSIFSAYNEGVKLAKFPYLCFMHDDLFFREKQNWGRSIKEILDLPENGLVGVVGTHYAPRFPLPWWNLPCTSGQYLEGYLQKDGTYSTKLMQNLDAFAGNNTVEAVWVDGIWFCIRKELFDNGSIEFDEQTYQGFHCYDMDICFQVRNAGYKVMITSDVLIEHTNTGFSADAQWMKSLVKLYFKWQNVLPAVAGRDLTQKQIAELESKIINRIADNIDGVYARKELLQKTLNSKAYRIGKMICKPFRLLKRIG